MNEQHSQAFRVRSPSEVITIPTRHDPKSNQRVVCWTDIQQYFEHARGVLNGNDAVLFLTDDNLEYLTPYRIAYHPDVILEVLVTDDSRGYLRATEAFGSTSTSRDVDSPRSGHHNYALVTHAQSQSLETQAQPHSSSQTRNMCPHRPHALPRPLDLDTNQTTHDHPLRLQLEMDYITTIQEQLQQLEQRTQQMQHQIVEILQETQQTRQQVDDVPGKIHHSEQQIQHQIEEIQQRIQQLQVCVNGTDYANHSPVDQIQELILKRLQGTLRRQTLMQYRVQKLLCTLSDDLTVPRLFFILPKDAGLDNEQRKPDSWLFRLHFLCDCSSHTLSKGARRVHEVHMTNHPGYDIKNPKEFFGKHGSYVLTMMYLVKYGAIGSGFVLPPLAQSNLVGKIEENQESQGFVKENVDQLVDNIITYLEDITRAFGREIDTASQWNTSPTNLEELKSYLDIYEGEHFPRDLYQLTTSEGYHSWVCGEHRLEWTMKHLKDVVNSIGGSYTEKQRDIDIKATSEQAVKQLYDAITDVFKIQSNTNVLLLKMDCGRLSLRSDVSREAKDVSMIITRLSDLTSDDLEFIQQCNITQLEVKYTPNETDEDRLTKILNQNAKVRELHIGCHSGRALAIINLVLSAREKNLQSGSSALHIFKIMNELGPVNFDSWTACEKEDRITTTMTFSKESVTFDMDTHIKLQNQERADEGSEMSKFFRQYGWSISTFTTSWTFNNHLAVLLDDATRIHGSRLTRLVIIPRDLTADGLDAMDRIIKRSPRLEFLWLFFVNLEQKSQQEKALLLLGRYGDQLNQLSVYGDSTDAWMSQLAKTFPTRNNFPVLSRFDVGTHSKRELLQECINWIATMISTPPESPGTSSIEDSYVGTIRRATGPSVIHLKWFQLFRVSLQPQDWETLIKAIDFSKLKDLQFGSTNFSQEQLGVLIDSIAAADVTAVPLNTLNVANTDLLVDADKQALRERIEKVAPQVSIVGL